MSADVTPLPTLSAEPHAPGRRVRFVLRLVLAAGYLIAGLAHLTRPEPFMLITPGWVPFPREIILATGACEIAGALALFGTRLRKLAGVMLALYAIGVFPANIKHAVDGVSIPPIPDSWWYHGPRLAFQPVLVWAALFGGDVIDWPLRRRPIPTSATAPCR
ncbi:hypothetical protein CCR97_16050 [Rhodoplanes elegans]|uniref:DoxX family protein n=1 Tax=Rhodoplanes elegans TaxID=29408 RepID=A0A327KQ87_9BRAD|nr:hypothetical protein [Rhodoplanes elegans]RAI40581.1 hypothetical protein CH338_05830 [Rhodoplanes elegans]